MSWECACGDGWTGMLLGWLGVRIAYMVLASHVLGWTQDYKLFTSLTDFAGTLIAWLM